MSFILAQGKAYTDEQRTTIIESLRAYLELGYSRNKACNFVGLDATTLSKWVKDDEALSMKLSSWENLVNTIAISNIKKAIQIEGADEKDTRKENSWKWLERKEESFKPKQDVTTNDKDLPTPIASLPNGIPRNNSIQTDQ